MTKRATGVLETLDGFLKVGMQSVRATSGQGARDSGTSVLSANAAVPALGWQVFVERPAAEVGGPLRSVALRGILLPVLGLAAVVLTGAAAARRVRVPRPAQV
jgi:hypothetical protein